MSYLRLRFSIVAILCLFMSVANAADVKAGKTLFINNCATCHNKNMKDKLTGPALSGVEDRWGGDKKALAAWIRNSQAMVAKGHPRAVAVYNEYNKSIMTSFPNLTDADIDNLLEYINNPSSGTAGPKKLENEAKEESSPLMYILLLSALGALAFILSRIVRNLKAQTFIQDGKTPEHKNLVEILTSRTAISLTIFALVILGGYTTVNNAISLGRQQNYAPEQPIKFSHATHAGVNKIDCQYCHDGARRSKQSLIPATNTCMNCHTAVKKGSQYGTAEISKIYASIGFDPNTDKYIPNYENLSEKEIETIYKKWIGDTYMADRKLTKRNNDVASWENDQWAGIKSSLTNEIKSKIQGPIEWKRIHNLPDHAYFNHAQHVTVGKVACQKCHGQVEKMEVVKQYAPLSMGWCVNCHRETEVKFKENDYYKSYHGLQEKMKNGEMEKVTVEDIGGLECQKCHY